MQSGNIFTLFYLVGTQPTPKSRSNYALFLGHLSIFCSEKDIEDLFQQYGEIVNVRIQRSKETSRALSYGFIEFSCETAAVTAMNELNGHVLKGRPLRIRWAAKRNQPVKSENTALHSAATIFVKFASQTGIIVTEEILREHFSVFGNILDTTIRTITIDEVSDPPSHQRSSSFSLLYHYNQLLTYLSVSLLTGIQQIERIWFCKFREFCGGGWFECCRARLSRDAECHCRRCELPL